MLYCWLLTVGCRYAGLPSGLSISVKPVLLHGTDSGMEVTLSKKSEKLTVLSWNCDVQTSQNAASEVFLILRKTKTKNFFFFFFQVEMTHFFFVYTRFRCVTTIYWKRVSRDSVLDGISSTSQSLPEWTIHRIKARLFIFALSGHIPWYAKYTKKWDDSYFLCIHYF